MDPPKSRPIYREAYAGFDIVEAQAASNRAPSGCLFQLKRWPLGHLILPDNTDTSVLIAYALGGPYCGFETSELWIETREVRNPVHRNRRTMLCPQCSAKKSTIFFKDEWACAKCHKLGYRSQYVDSKHVEWKEYDELLILTSNGRPKGMHDKTFARMRRQLEILEFKLRGKSRSDVASRHSYECISEWVPLDDFDELWVPGYSLRNRDAHGNLIRDDPPDAHCSDRSAD